MTAIVYHPIYTKHATPRGHPECAERVLSIQKALQKSAIPGVEWLIPRSGRTEDLLCHSAEYIALVQKEVNECKGSFFRPIRLLSTGDVAICTDSFETALYAVGGVLTACDWVCENRGANAFVIVRPPGHHATKNQGMGFCIFNNVACGARYVQKKYGLKRVLIIDWDVHHGNGTQDIFNDDPSVLYFSTHQKGIYPGTGTAEERGIGNAVGTKCNCPIEAGEGSREAIFAAFDEQLPFLIERYPPDCIFISCGFDAHINDPLGDCTLTTEDFVTLTTLVRGYAERYAQGRLISVLEGGYDLRTIAEASCVHVKALSINL